MTDQFPDVTKMVLSPAAQAVMDAYYSTDSFRAAPALAAVLRAAAKHLSYQLSFEDSRCVNVPDLLAIADELEGITYGTYRCNLKVLPND
jgi:hypothetical protein